MIKFSSLLSTISTAAAPAFCAFRLLVVKAQAACPGGPAAAVERVSGRSGAYFDAAQAARAARASAVHERDDGEARLAAHAAGEVRLARRGTAAARRVSQHRSVSDSSRALRPASRQGRTGKGAQPQPLLRWYTSWPLRARRARGGAFASPRVVSRAQPPGCKQ